MLQRSTLEGGGISPPTLSPASSTMGFPTGALSTLLQAATAVGGSSAATSAPSSPSSAPPVPTPKASIDGATGGSAGSSTSSTSSTGLCTSSASSSTSSSGRGSRSAKRPLPRGNGATTTGGGKNKKAASSSPLTLAPPPLPMMVGGMWAAPAPAFPWPPVNAPPPSSLAATVVGPGVFVPPNPSSSSTYPPPPPADMPATPSTAAACPPPFPDEGGVKPGEMHAHVGLLPGVRPLAFDQHLPAALAVEDGGGGARARRAHRECLSGLSAEEKLERRRERARAYSHMVRRRTEASLRELMGELERLTVFRLLVEEAADATVVLSPDPTACVLFVSRPDLPLAVGRPLAEAFHPDDGPKALKGVLGVAARPDACYRTRLRLNKTPPAARGEEGEYVAVDVTMKRGTQGVICSLRRAGEAEGFYAGGWSEDERVLVV